MPQRKRQLISFMDLGSGPTAERGHRLAKYRENRKPAGKKIVFNTEKGKRTGVSSGKGKFVSADLDRRVLINERKQLIGQRHHRFLQMDVFDALKRQQPNSVKVVNDDYLLDYLSLEPPVKAFGDGVRGGTFSVTPSEAHSISQQSRGIIRKYVKSVFRVLIPNGRLYITIGGLFEKMLEEELGNAGFTVEKRKILSDAEVSNSPSNYGKDVKKQDLFSIV